MRGLGTPQYTYPLLTTCDDRHEQRVHHDYMVLIGIWVLW